MKRLSKLSLLQASDRLSERCALKLNMNTARSWFLQAAVHIDLESTPAVLEQEGMLHICAPTRFNCAGALFLVHHYDRQHSETHLCRLDQPEA